LVDENSTQIGGYSGVKLYKDITEQFVKDNPDDFIGIKLIMTTARLVVV
jgi:hypothetical protein